EYIMAEVDLEIVADERLEQPAHEIRRDRVGADNDQRIGQRAQAEQVQHQVKRGKEEEAEPAAEQDPARSPDPLDDWAHTEMAEGEPAGQAEQTRENQPHQLPPGWPLAAEHAAGQEAENHRAQGRNETQGRVAAAVEAKWRLARQTIQEPGVECPGQVTVL